MKKVVDINIAGSRFSIEEDAFSALKSYLKRFEASIENKEEAKEIMEDVELRVAELFQKEIKVPNQVVNIEMVNSLINCMGDFDTTTEGSTSASSSNYEYQTNNETRLMKKLYRSSEDNRIAGVCGGLSVYLDVDPTLIRILFLAALIFAGSTFWVYLVIWFITPKAETIVQKLEMRGIPVTAENIKNFGNEK